MQFDPENSSPAGGSSIGVDTSLEPESAAEMKAIGEANLKA
jgi:hypothetical protein